MLNEGHMMTRVLIVDNHEMVRNGLRDMLGINDDIVVVGDANDGRQAIEMARELEPDLVIMDVRMPEIDGVTACREIIKSRPETKVLMLSIYDDDNDIFASIDAGATGFMIKNVTQDDLCKVVDIMRKGQSYFHPIIAKKMADKFRKLSVREKEKTTITNLLTRREIEILELLGRGLSNADISKALFISDGTVKSHISHLLRKLDRRDRTQLAIYAFEKGLVEKNSIR